MNFDDMNGYQFEDYIETLLKNMGFIVRNVGYSNDGGIDLIAEYKKPIFQGKYIVQCKKWNENVGQPPIRDLYGVTVSEGANKGILITTSDFTQQAREFAEGKNIELINGVELRQLVNVYKNDENAQNDVSQENFMEDCNFDKERFLYLVKKSEENPNDGKHYDNLLRFIYEYIVELKQYTYLESVATEYIGYSEKCIKNCYSKRTKKETYIRNGIKIKIAYILAMIGKLDESLEILSDIGVEAFRQGFSGRTFYKKPNGEVYEGNNSDLLYTFYYKIFNLLGMNDSCNYIDRFFDREGRDVDCHKILMPIEIEYAKSFYWECVVAIPYTNHEVDLEKVINHYKNVAEIKNKMESYLSIHTEI